MTQIVEGRTVTDAVLAVLRDVLDFVGDGIKETGSGWTGDVGASEFQPYATLHSIPGGTLDGPIGEPNDDATQIYQVTAVGSTRPQCEWVADVARAALVGQNLDIEGRDTVLISIDMLSGARRDQTVEPVVWISTDRYRVDTTPSTPPGS